MENITSKENSRIKHLVRLSASKSARDESGCFVAEGLRLCIDAQGSGIAIREAYFTAAALKKHPQLQALSEYASESFLIDEAVAAKISDTKSTQGIFALCEKHIHAQLVTPKQKGRYLLLDSLQDPGNIGTIIRTAEALGIDGLIMSADCPDLYSPKVLRATMGGVFRLPASISEDIPGEIARLRAEGVAVYAAALDEHALQLGKIRFDGACAMLIGNEGAGLTQDLIAACTATVMIPMAGRADSLNGAMAAGILLWEMTKEYD